VLEKKCDVTIHSKLRAATRKEILDNIHDKDGIVLYWLKIIQGNELVKQKKWKVGWMPKLLLGTDLNGMTLGILGLGRVGSAVARRAKGFNMKIIYHNRQTRNYQTETELDAKSVDLNGLLKQSDFLSIHASLNTSSFHLLNRSQFKVMKKTAYVINTSRGQIINERDLVEALNKKMIAGAALDVFEKEPVSRYNSLLRMKNVVTPPHIGSATFQTRSKMSQVAVQNLLNVFDGKPPVFLVNNEIKNRNIYGCS
jgi:lactate dehydrogenase-like 2-hydroxyacid dehydrogenase